MQLTGELPVVRDFLQGFPVESQAIEGYCAVRSFLKSYAGNEAPFSSYRTHVERLLLCRSWLRANPFLSCDAGMLRPS